MVMLSAQGEGASPVEKANMAMLSEQGASDTASPVENVICMVMLSA